MDACEREYVATERAAIIAVHLVTGYRLTTAQIARLLGMTDEGARLLMWKVTRAVAVDFDDDAGVWYWAGPRYVASVQDTDRDI